MRNWSATVGKDRSGEGLVQSVYIHVRHHVRARFNRRIGANGAIALSGNKHNNPAEIDVLRPSVRISSLSR